MDRAIGSERGLSYRSVTLPRTVNEPPTKTAVSDGVRVMRAGAAGVTVKRAVSRTPSVGTTIATRAVPGRSPSSTITPVRPDASVIPEASDE